MVEAGQMTRTEAHKVYVSCYDCNKPLEIESLRDGTQMILLDGSRINICHRCGAIRQGFEIKDFDAVWGSDK